MIGGFTYRSPYLLAPGQPFPGRPTLLRPPIATRRRTGRVHPEGQPPIASPLGWAHTRWYRNINLLCIDYASRPRLSSRLTLGGLAFPRNPWAYGGGVSHPSLATHTNILTRPRSTTVHTVASQRDRRSPTTPVPDSRAYDDTVRGEPHSASRLGRRRKSAASALDLSPVTLSAQDHSTSELLRTLSRMAASEPTSGLSLRSHIVFHLVKNLGP